MAYYEKSPGSRFCPCSTGPALPKDCGPQPTTINLSAAVRANAAFRTVLWTGGHLQLTVMSIPVGENIGLEVHEKLDQLLYLDKGCGLVKMGPDKENPELQRTVCAGAAILIPAGCWHNFYNTGCCAAKLFSVYAPPQHPKGTVHCTKADAEHDEEK